MLLTAIVISRPQWRRPTCTVHSVWLPQFPRMWTNNLEQTSTGYAKQTLANSLNVGLKAGYLSAPMQEMCLTDVWLKVCRINGLNYRYLLTKYKWMILVHYNHKSASQLLLTRTDIQWGGDMKDATAFSKVEFTKEVNVGVDNGISMHSFQHKLPNQIVSTNTIASSAVRMPYGI